MSAHPLDFHANGEFSPAKTPFSGVHFSDSDIAGGVLHGARRGSSPQATDAHRVKLGRGAPPAVHVYESGAVAHPSIASRKHALGVSGNFAIADIDGGARATWANALTSSYKENIANGVDPAMAKSLAANSAEHALLEAGWDGYRASKHQPGSAIIFGNVKTDKIHENNSKDTSSTSPAAV